jgi:hypothetical protein
MIVVAPGVPKATCSRPDHETGKGGSLHTGENRGARLHYGRLLYVPLTNKG